VATRSDFCWRIISFVMRTPKLETTILALGLVTIVACAGETGRSDAPTDSSSTPTPTAADSQSAGPVAEPTAWTVTPSGIGPVQVGTAASELANIAGEVPQLSGGECEYVRPARLPSGVSLMIARGQVARIDVDSGGVRTAEGVAVGDSASRIAELYAGRTTTMPHKYVPEAQYITARGPSPADSANRIVFEVERGRVTRYRAGRIPEVEWVERCG
jgi:hypothetical protein